MTSVSVSGSFARVPEERIQRMLFLAVTRATRWCYFSTDAPRSLAIIGKTLQPLMASGAITEFRKTGAGLSAQKFDGDLDFL